MLCGLPPFYNEDISKMYELIKYSDLKFPKRVKLNDDTKDFIKVLLERNPTKRLGAKGFEEIKGHPFFSVIDFDEVLNKKLPTPIKPELKGEKDLQFFDEEFTNEEVGETYIDKSNMDMINKNQYRFNDFNR